MTDKEKTLIALAASVAAGCRPCTEHYVGAARAAGACDRGLTVAVEAALAVRESATRGMDAWALQCQGSRPELDAAFRTEKRQITELASVAAAYAVNSAIDLTAHLDAARAGGATAEQIQIAIGIAQSIKRTAEEKANAALEAKPASGCCGAPNPQKQPTSCGCAS